MINFILLLCTAVLANNPHPCANIAGDYQLADGRGRQTGTSITVEATAADVCVFTVLVPEADMRDSVTVSGNSVIVTSGKYTDFTGEIDERGLILWNNGYYYWPSHLPEAEIPMDCLHPFSLHCYSTCSHCSHCAEDHEAEGCDEGECDHCAACADFIPCLDAVKNNPECVEPEAFECLRECRQCTSCDEFSDCQGLVSTFDEFCVSMKAVECLDCQEDCERCTDFIPCLEQLQRVPEDQMYCINEEAIHCQHDCGHCSECSDRMNCLELFEPSRNMCEVEAFMNLLESFDEDIKQSCHHAMSDGDNPAEDCPCFNHLLDTVSLTLDIDCFWSEESHETLREEAERMCRPSKNMCDVGAFTHLLESLDEDIQQSCRHAMSDGDNPDEDCPCFNHLIDTVSLTLDIDCFWSEESHETLREEAERMCRRHPSPPHPQGLEIEVSNYPCATHGSEADSINQVYSFAGMGANDRPIFQGTQDARWWIYFDEDCGGHEARWFLSPAAPDFSRSSNLQHSSGGCTNTLQFNEHEAHFPSMTSVSRYFCDGASWENEFTQNGWMVQVEFRSAIAHPVCNDDDDYFRQMLALFPSATISSCSDLNTDDLRNQWCPQTDGACGCQCSEYPITQCMDFRDGNYQVNDANTGEVVAHFSIHKEGCHGSMTMQSSTDHIEMPLSFFMNRVETIDAEGTLFVGVPTAAGELIFNDMYRFSFMDCMIIYSGDYEVMNGAEHVGHHFMHQNGCHAESFYKGESGEENRATFVLTHTTLSGEVNGEMIEGERGEGLEIQWSNGYVSFPRWEGEDAECHEDGQRFYVYVRGIVPGEHDHRVSEVLQKIEWEGCNLLRIDPELKENFCLFHPEVRDACSCVCNEDHEPRHVCSPKQFESWMTRDLGHECQMLFISGLAEEHRPACDCMRAIPHDAAEELFGSECYFSSWSDRSFYRIWDDCQHHY